jgi:hypothetical protein
MSEDVPGKTAARAQCRRGAYLKVYIPGIRSIDQNNGRATRSNQRRAYLNDEARAWDILSIESQSSR